MKMIYNIRMSEWSKGEEVMHICSKVDCVCGCSYCALCYDGCPQCGRGKVVVSTSSNTSSCESFPWKPLVSLSDLPKNRSFLLYDSECTSGLHIYEAMIFDDGTMGCPATCDKYELSDFSHWREMIDFPKKDECQ